jgi:hypothetical protein
MAKVELEDKEWAQVISALAATTPLIAKISAQLVAQKKPERNPHDGEDYIETNPRAVIREKSDLQA